MKVVSIAANAVRRLLRDRSNIFFVFLFPMLLILVIGASFGGAAAIGVVAFDDSGGPFSAEILASLESSGDLEIEMKRSADSVTADVERGLAEAGLVFAAGFDETLAGGSAADIGYVARQTQLSVQVRALVEAAVAESSIPLRAASAVSAAGPIGFDEALAAADRTESAVGGVNATLESVGTSEFAGLGQFDLGASQQLLLFVFLTSLVAATAVIQARIWGVSRRMLASPTPARTIVAGEMLGRVAVATLQGVIIIGGSMFLGVRWGDPIGAAVLLVAFALVSAGAGLLLGSIFSNDQQAGSSGVLIGLGFAALGGCMVPIEIFPPTMRQVAHLTPHAWALDGFAELVRRDGSVIDILPELGVLLGFAAVLMGLASWRFRAVLVR